MRTIAPRMLALASVAGLAAGCADTDPAADPLPVEYPETATVEQVDMYHGTPVADPYRWLEEDVRESDRVARWVAAQNEVTSAYLAGIPERSAINRRLTALWDFEKYSIPVKRGGRYFYEYNDGLANQDQIFVQRSADAEPELLIDPNLWAEDGTVALSAYYPSPDGKYLACLIQRSGSDWRQARVFDVDAGEFLDDDIQWLKFTDVTWAADSSGFYYSRYPEPADGEAFQSLNKNHAIYFHAIGAAQDQDQPVYARSDEPEWGFDATATEDGRFLVVTVWKGTDSRYRIALADLEADDPAPRMLIDNFDFEYTFIGNVGRDLLFRTNNAAPLGRIIAIDADRPAADNWREVVAESDAVLDGASIVGGRVIAQYLRDARSEVRIFGLDGSEERMVDLPGIGSAGGFDGSAEDPETFFSFSSFNRPPTIYRMSVNGGAPEVFRTAKVDFDPADYVVKQVFFESRYGPRVPMFISHRKDLLLDGRRPALLYGYGGFDISLRPGFSITRLSWMEMGGVYAVANLRGGGEYGEAWHKAGTRLQKQNVFDDFIAAGEYLVANDYTSPDKLAILGGSNGGLLVGAVTNQRPDLFGAALPAVGVMDMVRFNRFTAGRFWVDDYGSPDNPEEFRALYAYSPYHNIQPRDYPAVMVSTADTDDRVVPGHSFKYAAALQAAQTGPEPVLIRIETKAGHGAGTPTEKIIEEYADRWAFLLENLDFDLPDGYGS